MQVIVTLPDIIENPRIAGVHLVNSELCPAGTPAPGDLVYVQLLKAGEQIYALGMLGAFARGGKGVQRACVTLRGSGRIAHVEPEQVYAIIATGRDAGIAATNNR